MGAHEEAGASISQTLAEWAAGLTAADLPSHVIDDARWRFVDMVGVCLAGSRDDAAGSIARVAAGMGGERQATVVAFGTRLPAPLAAWANAAIGHGPDYDDTHGAATVHISNVAIPASLAAAEALGASGTGCLVAFAAGSEVALRIGVGAQPQQFHRRGLHGTGIAGPFAAAVIGSKLLHLDKDHMAHALGMAGSQSSGLLQAVIDGSWSKRLQPGWACQAGLMIALMAREGFTGPTEVLEGRFGLFNALLHNDDEAVHLGRITDGLGSRWLLPDTTYKPWPNGAANHSAMDGVAAIMNERRLTAYDIERVDVFVPSSFIPLVCEPREAKLNPATPYHVKFSLPYSVALVAVRGSLEADDFNATLLLDGVVREFASRVFCHADPSMTPDYWPARVEVVTRSGDRVIRDVPRQRGGPGNPMPPAEHRRKFLNNTLPTLGEASADRLLNALENIWDEPDIRSTMMLTAASKGPRLA